MRAETGPVPAYSTGLEAHAKQNYCTPTTLPTSAYHTDPLSSRRLVQLS